jgi:hypothetical protein
VHEKSAINIVIEGEDDPLHAHDSLADALAQATVVLDSRFLTHFDNDAAMRNHTEHQRRTEQKGSRGMD